MNFRRYLLKKTVYVIITIFFIASLNFLLFQVIAGDPTYVLLPRGCGTSNVTGECPLRAELIHEWALDQPLTVRFITYLRNVFTGNLGTSITYQTGVPVATIIAPRLWTTLILVGVATAATMWLGIILGRISGWRRGRPTDVIITLSTLFGYSMPSFWVSLLLIFSLSVAIRIFPVYWDFGAYARMDLLSTVADYTWHLVLPVATLTAIYMPLVMKNTRSTMEDMLGSDFVTYARAAGLSRLMQLRYALRNSLPSVVTIIGILFWFLLGGAVLVETVFAWGGLGQYAVQSVVNSDYAPLQAFVLLTAVFTSVVFLLVDLAYFFLDPRIRA